MDNRCDKTDNPGWAGMIHNEFRTPPCQRDPEECDEKDERIAKMEARVAELERLLNHASHMFGNLSHDAVCNGVHAPWGMCEGDMHYGDWLDETIEALRAKEQGQ